MRLFFTVILTLLLAGCSPNWHIRQALKKDPTIIRNDTIITVDTIYREVEKIDTIFSIKKVKVYDTIEYVKDSVIARVIKLPGDSILVECDCPPCEDIIKTKNIIKTIKVEPNFWQKMGSIWGTYLILIVVLFGLSRKL